MIFHQIPTLKAIDLNPADTQHLTPAIIHCNPFSQWTILTYC